MGLKSDELEINGIGRGQVIFVSLMHNGRYLFGTHPSYWEHGKHKRIAYDMQYDVSHTYQKLNLFHPTGLLTHHN